MHDDRCPRCGEALLATAYWEAMPACDDRLPAYRLRHKRASGKTCIVYAGETIRAACEAQTARPSVRLREAMRDAG